MVIKKIGFVSFKLKYGDFELVTDPILTRDAGVKIPKTSADLAIITDPEYSGKSTELELEGINKIEPNSKEKVTIISGPGEYEVGGIMIRRSLGSDYYIIDEGSLRTVYMGQISKAINPEKLGDLGDVDILILPVGNADIFPSFEKLEDIIKRVDPTYLIPCGYSESGLDAKYKDLKSIEDFQKQSGFTHIRNEKKFTLKSGAEPENKVVEVIILE